MKKFILHGEMASDFCKEISLNANTMREAIEGLCANFPKFRKYYISKSLKGVHFLFVDNSKQAMEHYCFDLPLSEDTYNIVPSMQGSAMAGVFLANFGLGYLMQKFMNDMQPIEDDGTPEYEIIKTNSFIYSQNENRAEQGVPIPVVYGQLRVGSKTIHSSINNYDYNYDDAEIYAGNPTPTKISKMAANYSFIKPKEVEDLRSRTLLETFSHFNAYDKSKRAELTFDQDGEKIHDLTRENEPMNHGYSNNSSSSNEHKSFGPSENNPVYARADASWWDFNQYNSQPRPYLYPQSGEIDFFMRPQSASSLCGERLSKSGSVPLPSEKTLSWKNRGSKMTVGVRGNYQKLESIGIHKSLEVLSEGPIAGLAGHITGFSTDNGSYYFPYQASDPAPAPGSITLGSVKYDFSSSSIVSQSNNSLVNIISSGSFYNNFTGTLTGNSIPVNGLSIRVNKPISLKSAKIRDITFSGPDDPSRIVYHINNSSTPNSSKFVSSNDLFLLNSGDGSIHPNSNSLNTISEFLESKYLVTESTVEAGTTGVFQLDLLASDSNDLNQDFRIGSNYGRDGLEFSISPDSSRAILEEEIKLTKAGDRDSRGSVLDVRSRFKDGLFESDFESIFNTFKNYTTDSNVPWDSSISIQQMVRVAYDQNGGSALVGASGTVRTATVQVAIGEYTDTWTSGSGMASRTNTQTRNINANITFSNYLSLGQVNIILEGLQGTASNRQATRFSYSPINAAGNRVNYFQAICEGSSFATNTLDRLLRDAGFANDVFNAFNTALGGSLQFSILPSFMLDHDNDGASASILHGGGRYIKFGVGSGSTISQGTLLNGTLPTHTIQSNLDNFDNVLITDDGSIPEDDSSNPKGKYHPMIYPRITVFILRKKISSGFTSFDYLPTNINAIAEISANGTIANIHLLNVPDNPVYDKSLSGWTPILPHSNKEAPFMISASTIRYEDLGVYCRIDSSDSKMEAKLYASDGVLQMSASRRDSFKAETLWSNHIAMNDVRPESSFAEGLFPELSWEVSWDTQTNFVKTFNFSEVPPAFETPTREAAVTVIIEGIILNSTMKIQNINNALQNTNRTLVCTGRPQSMVVSDSGVGYIGKDNKNLNGSSLSRDIFPETFSVGQVRIRDDLTSNKGYRPNSNFYIFGIAQSKNFTLNALNEVYLNFKAKVKVDKFGSISNVKILDGGIGFADTSDRLITADIATAIRDAGVTMGIVPTTLPTSNLDPAINFPKQDLILAADDLHLRRSGLEGSISKFYVKQIGLGFNYTQILLDPFSSISYVAPSFDVEIDDGTLKSIQISSNGQGYGVEDSNIELRFSKPTNSPPSQNVPTSLDPNAWARSIFLNDVPIRDSNDRFNYSKFHFDIRVGHYKNGNKEEHIPSSILASSSQDILMSEEFRLPSFTKIVDFPLYGPRNQGDKDYFYAHTIKNPEISVVSLSFKIEKLHYIYEGDESALYVNLIPLIAVGIGIMAGKAIAEQLAASVAVPDLLQLAQGGIGKVIATGIPCGLPFGAPTFDNGAGMVNTIAPAKDVAKAGFMGAFFGALAGAVGGMIIGMITKMLIKCSDVPWLCFKVGEIVKNSGEIWPAKVEFAIEYGVEGEPLKKDIIALRGCATNPYVKDVLIENLPQAESFGNDFKNRILRVYRLTRELDPVNGGIIEARYQIETSLHSVTEHVAGFFNYNNTAIIGTRINSKDLPQPPKKEYLIKGRLINIPDNYNPGNGTYSGDWSGSFSTSLTWTSNPAWIIFDLLTNERYGMGKYGISESDIDIWSFYTFSKFCDERVETIIDGKAHLERRHMCNLYIDSERQAYDYINDLMKIYNCTINFSGGKIYITVDSSIEVSSGSIMVFTNSNIEEEGFSYSSTPETERITSATVDYLDERDNYMQKSEYVEDSPGIREHGYSHKKIAGMGITRRGEAYRLAWHTVLSRQLEREIVQFKTGLQGSYLRIGDVVDIIDNKKISKHSGGRIARVINSTNIEIDIPTSALSDVSEILIELPVLSDDNANTTNSLEIPGRRKPQYKAYAISARVGFVLTLNAALDVKIKQGYSWIIKENSIDDIEPKKYRIKQIKESSPMKFELSATEYVESKYKNIDSRDGIDVQS